MSMEEGASQPSAKAGRLTPLVGFSAALGLALAFPRAQPGKFLMAGFFGLILVNIFLFTANLMEALSKSRGKTEAELENLLVPALQGEPNVVKPGLKYLCAQAFSFCVGFIMSAIILIVLRHYRVLPWGR